MSKMKRFLKKTAATFMAVAMSAGIIASTAQISAAPIIPDKGNLYIHSYSIPDMKYAGERNDGNEAKVPENSVALEGIEFKVYKLDTSITYPTSGECTVDSVSAPAKATDIDGNEFAVTLTTTVTTDSEGTALASDLEKGVYLVVEQKSEKVARPSAPYLVAVPMTNAAGDGWIKDVHTYPKSNDISISKAVDRTSVSVGEVVTWTLMPTAGSVAEDCVQYDVTDPLDTALDFVEGSVVVYGVNGTTETLIANTNYTVNVDADNLLTVSFNEAGRKLVPTYDSLKIDFKTKTNKEILKRVNYTVYNQASVILNNKYSQTTKRDSNIVKIHTAVVNVFKTTPTGSPLAGAVFSIASSEANAKDGKYLKIDADGNIIDVNEAGYDEASVWSITTGTDGYAKFEGLRDYDIDGNHLTYYLVETAAPAGYSLLGVPVNAQFTADNSKEATAYTIEVTIKNDEIPELPKTGGNGTWMYTSAGVVVLALGLAMILFVLKRKTEKEEN